MDEIEFRLLIDEALSKQMRDENGDSRYLATNWILVSEWTDYDGNRFLDTQVSDEMTPWNAIGMLQMAEHGMDLNDNIVDDEEDSDG